MQPQIQDVIIRNCHPIGCQVAANTQIKKATLLITQQPHAFTKHFFKQVLIFGASSECGLTYRIVLMFGPISVSYKRDSFEKDFDSADWCNNVFIKLEAKQQSLITADILGDAFADDTKQHIAVTVKTQFSGNVDTLVYSLAIGIRLKP